MEIFFTFCSNKYHSKISVTLKTTVLVVVLVFNYLPFFPVSKNIGFCFGRSILRKPRGSTKTMPIQIPYWCRFFYWISYINELSKHSKIARLVHYEDEGTPARFGKALWVFWFHIWFHMQRTHKVTDLFKSVLYGMTWYSKNRNTKALFIFSLKRKPWRVVEHQGYNLYCGICCHTQQSSLLKSFKKCEQKVKKIHFFGVPSSHLLNYKMT